MGFEMANSKKKILGKIFSANHDVELSSEANWLLSEVEKISLQGVEIKDGTKIQFGWSLLIFREVADQVEICEPNFAGDPFSSINNDLSITLQVQSAQNVLNMRLGIPPQSTSFQDKIVLSSGCLNDTNIYMERRRPVPEKSDSGWLIGNADENKQNDNIVAIYAYQLLFQRPLLLQLLQLPEGYMAIINESEVEAILNPSNERLT